VGGFAPLVADRFAAPAAGDSCFATCPSKPQAVSSAHLKENYALLKKLAEM